MDMRTDIFLNYSYGMVAMQKLKPENENFRLYCVEWLGDGKQREVMCVKGAVFREATRGKNKGQLCIKVPGTTRTVHVTAMEMDEFDAKKKNPSTTKQD